MRFEWCLWGRPSGCLVVLREPLSATVAGILKGEGYEGGCEEEEDAETDGLWIGWHRSSILEGKKMRRKVEETEASRDNGMHSRRRRREARCTRDRGLFTLHKHVYRNGDLAP